MSRTSLACYALTASAAVLAALLLVQLAQRGPVEPQAQAAMVIAQPSYTVMTARTRANEDSLFALDNTRGTLMIYRLDAQGQLLPATVVDIAAVFGEAFEDEGDPDDEREPVQRPGIGRPLSPQD